MIEAKQTTTPRGTWVLMGPDFLYSGQVRNCQEHVPRGCTPSRECQVPHSTQTQHPRPWLVCSGTENSAPPGLSQNHLSDICLLLEAHGGSSVHHDITVIVSVIALTITVALHSGPDQPSCRRPWAVSEAPLRPTATWQVSSIFIFCFIFLPGFYYTVQAGLELVSILITVLCGAVQFLQY